MNKLHCDLGKLILKNPVTVASGTFGSGKEFKDFYEYVYVDERYQHRRKCDFDLWV